MHRYGEGEMHVANISILKNKSNSQPAMWAVKAATACCKYQYFKEQKQFTTMFYEFFNPSTCCKYQYFKEQKQFTT